MRALLIFATLVIVICTVWFHFGAQATVGELKELSSEIRKESSPTMSPLKTTWVSEGPITHEVRTDWEDGDTIDKQTARHAARVAALKAAFPPIG
jgi:hypothetical protein